MIYKPIKTLTLGRNKADECRQNTYEARVIKPMPRAYRSEVKLNIDHCNVIPNRGTACPGDMQHSRSINDNRDLLFSFDNSLNVDLSLPLSN